MIIHKLRKFCPECHSTLMRRVHRGFVQKYLFRQKPKYKCDSCQSIFFIPLFEKDLKRLPKDNTLKIDANKYTEYEEIEIVAESS